MSLVVLITRVIYYFSQILELLIIIRCIISWLPIDRNSKLVELVYLLTEPILAPIRAIIAKSPLGRSGMMIDFSPLIAGFVIYYGALLINSVIVMLAI